jgi:hypothetical protein
MNNKTEKLAAITSLGCDVLIKLRKLQKSQENSDQTRDITGPRWRIEGRLLITWQGLCLVKGILVHNGIGTWEYCSNSLSENACKNLQADTVDNNEEERSEKWQKAKAEFRSLEGEAFHISKMWLKLRNEVFKNDEIKDLPENTEVVGLPTTEELQKWLDETNTLVKEAQRAVVLERIEKEKKTCGKVKISHGTSPFI